MGRIERQDGRTDGRTDADGSSFEGDGCVARSPDVKSDRRLAAAAAGCGWHQWRGIHLGGRTVKQGGYFDIHITNIQSGFINISK